MKDPLLTPLSIGTCPISNRFILTAASLCRCTDGFVTEDTIDFYRARAHGGVGLVIAGAAGVDPDRRSTTGMMQACDDAFLPGLSRLAQAIHEENGTIFLQLLHAGAYANPKEYGGAEPIAPSAYDSGLTRAKTKEMSLEQIRAIIGYFADAALRTQKAGFDGIELCGSVGYLIAEFLSSTTNFRTDVYGGPLENRMRFLLELVDAIKDATGSNFPLMIRLSGADCIPGGNSIEDVVQISKALEQHGVDAIDITGGWHESRIPQITGHVPHGAYRFLAKAVKEVVSIPVVACNRMDVTSGRKALASGCCDFVGLCRPFLADPNLVKKVEQGREQEIHRCLSCNQECLDRVFAGQPVGCTVNPFLGHEMQTYSTKDTGKKILVIGAGISGLAYAALAAKENQVEVWEKSGIYGGAGRLLSQLPHWEDCGIYVDSLYQDCLRQGIPFRWYQDVDSFQLRDLLQSGTYDKIVLAAGAKLRRPEFSVEDGVALYSLQSFVEQSLPLGKNTVILGNDFRALEFALYCTERNRLSHDELDFYRDWIPFLEPKEESPCSITCIGSQRKPGGGMAKSVQWAALQEAKKRGLITISEAKILRVTASEVVFLQEGAERSIPADVVILAQGWQSSPLADFTDWPQELAARVEVLGDAKTPGRITGAVHTAAKAALQME